MFQLKKSFNNWIKDSNGKLDVKKLLAFSLAVLVCFIATYEGVKSISKNYRIQKVYDTRTEMADAFSKNREIDKKEPIRQDKSIPGFVLLNVGDKDVTDFDAKDIHNIFVVLFEKSAKSGVINFVGLQKEIIVGKDKDDGIVTLKSSYDKSNPQKMYDAIEKMIDYKVESYMAYNNDTVKDVMDQSSFLNANVVFDTRYGIDDRKPMNDTIRKYAKECNVKDYDKIRDPGVQSLDKTQMLTYVNLYKDVWDCCWNDWRQLFFLQWLFTDMKNSNIGSLENIREMMLKGTHDIYDDHMIKIGAAIGEYKIGTINRWPNLEYPETHKGKEYRVANDIFECTKLLHRMQHGERGYKVSATVKNYAKTIKGIEGYIAEYAKKQDAKKRAKEEEKRRKAMEALNKSNEAQKYMDKETSANKDKDKNNQKKSRAAAKKGSNTKSKSGSRKSSSKKPSSKKPSSSKPSSKPANNNNDNDDSGGGEAPAPEPDPPSEGTDPSPAPEDNNE